MDKPLPEKFSQIPGGTDGEFWNPALHFRRAKMLQDLCEAIQADTDLAELKSMVKGAVASVGVVLVK